MRRMYSEQELTNIIKEVFDAEIADGAFDEKISDAVDAYLVENPVDITALEGLDISVKSITATDGIDIDELVDGDGHKRFLEGDLVVNEELTGVTFSYAKWSLSGTHLMLVLAGTMDDETELTSSSQLAYVVLPEWIKNKIYPVWADYNIERKTIGLVADDWSEQTTDVVLQQYGTQTRIINVSTTTLTADRGFRIQFDLLIDAE